MMAPALLSARCCACVGGTAFAGDAVRPAASLTAPLRAGARFALRGRRSLRMIAGAKVCRRPTAGAPPWAGTAVARRSEAAAAGFVALGLRMSDAAAAGFVELGLRMSEAAALGFAAVPWAAATDGPSARTAATRSRRASRYMAMSLAAPTAAPGGQRTMSPPVRAGRETPPQPAGLAAPPRKR